MDKDKKYEIILGLMIFLFVIVIAVIIAFGLGYIKIDTNKNGENSNSIASDKEISNTSDDTSTVTTQSNINQNSSIKNDSTNENNTTNVSNTSSTSSTTKENTTTSKNKEDLLITYVSGRKEKGKCALGDCDLYLDVNLPRINLDTNTAYNINAKIKDIYITSNEYYNQDFSNATGKNQKLLSFDIKSKYGYIPNVDCLYVSITKHTINSHASGSVDYYTYLYQVDNDKELSLQELLESKNITLAKISEKAKATDTYINAQDYEKQSFDNTIKDFSKIYIDSVNGNNITLLIPCNGYGDNILVDFSI